MNHHLYMKRVALLLLAGLFGFATLQTAAAQTGSHEVKIDVDKVNTISVDNTVSFDITSSDIGSEVTDETADLDVTTNAPNNRKVTVQTTDVTENDASLKNVSLKVESTKNLGGTSNEVTITSLGSNSTGSPEDFLTGVSSIDEDDVPLKYTAEVNYEYDPNQTVTFTVKYTLTGGGN